MPTTMSLGVLTAVGSAPVPLPAIGSGFVGLDDFMDIPVQPAQGLNLIYATTGSPATLAGQWQGSSDGVTWNNVGSAQSNTVGATVNTVSPIYAKYKFNLTTLAGGTNPTVQLSIQWP